MHLKLADHRLKLLKQKYSYQINKQYAKEANLLNSTISPPNSWRMLIITLKNHNIQSDE